MALYAEIIATAAFGVPTLALLFGIAKRQGSMETKVDVVVKAQEAQQTFNAEVQHTLTDHEVRLSVREALPSSSPHSKPELRQHAV